MKILIDIGHPAHVHLFKNFAYQMQDKGHRFLFTCREKEFEIELLKAFGFQYVSFGKKYNSLPGKIFGLAKFDALMLKTGISFRPDILMSHGSPYAAHAAALLGKPHISMEDTGNMEQIKLYLPFTKAVLSPIALRRDLGKKHIKYSGYHELAYLHPNYFTPKKDIYSFLNCPQDQSYVIIRFVSWNASHDKNEKGLTAVMKSTIVKHLIKKHKVYISSEGELPEEFLPYQIQIPPQKIHDALAFATLYIGEGVTMASECAVLGTPAIFTNTFAPDVIYDQEEKGLLVKTIDEVEILNTIKEFEENKELKNSSIEKKDQMLSGSIDVSSFLTWFVENFPESKEILSKNPEHQYTFN